MRRYVVGAALAACVGASGEIWAADGDRDGIDDRLEQALIERFVPRFLVSAEDCAGRPAKFTAFDATPRVDAQDGTIYARVSPVAPELGLPVALELHYYHLWERDCGGLNAHPLDVEHVSAILVAKTLDAGADEWTARYWYAAAHEDTVCDTSNAARAEAVNGVSTGPTIWISAGKHASFLSLELCGERGCGADRCEEMEPLEASALVNLGEAGVPLAGSLWTASPEWPFTEKLDNDFDRALVDRLDADEPQIYARVNGDWRVTHFSLSVGAHIIEGTDTAGRHGAGGISEAETRSGSAVGKAFRGVGRAFGAFGRALGLTRDDEEEDDEP